MTGVVRGGIRTGVGSLSARRWRVLATAVLPVLLTPVLFVAHGVATGRAPTAYGFPMAYLLYGLANVVVVAGLYAELAPAERTAVFRFRPPTVRELAWVGAAFPIGLGGFVATDAVLSRFGFAMTGLSYALSDPATIGIVILGAIIVAPVTEEILYRGLVLGKLLSEGFHTAAAVGAMLALFGAIHFPYFGVTGTVFVTLWGALPAVLRLRFDNLSGAVLLHMLNNAYAYVIVVALGLY